MSVVGAQQSSKVEDGQFPSQVGGKGARLQEQGKVYVTTIDEVVKDAAIIIGTLLIH